MQKQSSYSPLLLKYLKAYETNPRSRVFAPLAETYRKMGMGDKAMSILKEGIKNNPGYTLGYLGLSFCYFDQEQYSLAYTTLRPLVGENRDNLRLQKLFGNVCLQINNLDEALETFKYLLFINPRDVEASKHVKNLEDKLMSPFTDDKNVSELLEEEIIEKEDFFQIDDLNSSPMFKEENNWSQVDFSNNEDSPEQGDELLFEEYSPILREPSPEAEGSSEYLSEINATSLDIEEKSENSPVVTHTLVDLYCAQGHLNKALEVLEKILALNPTDEKTLLRLEEIKGLVGKPGTLTPKKHKDEGRSNLMAVFDSKIGKDDSTNKEILQKKLIKFRDAIKKRAKSNEL
jgi:tetratricopeptide (TPR) repeat protein